MQTSAIAPSGSGSSAGLTLLELLVVVTLLAFLALLAAPQLGAGQERLALRRALQESLALIQSSRDLAIAQGRPVRLTIDLIDKRLVSDAGTVTLPTAARLETETAAIVSTNDQAGLLFLPDGSCTGGTITLVLGTQQRQLAVDWLTGRAQLRVNQGPGA